jgi:hypothetical protein
VAPRSSHRLQIAAAVALAVVGFAASFGVARLTNGDAKGETPSQAGQASIAVLPPEAARLVRLSPGGAIPALKPAATTAAVQPQTPETPQPQPQPQPQPEATTAPAPAPEPTAPQPTTYIP